MSLDVSVVLDDRASPDDIKEAKSRFAMTPQFRLDYSTGEAPHLVSVEPWEIPFFDVSLLKAWMQGCDAVHGSRCVASGPCQIDDLPPGFRVIDVCAMKIVKPAHPVSFVALSYMWQQSEDNSHVQLERGNLKELEISGGITNIPLPNIISDAISLCRDLGESYLWIDQLCIIQDDIESKQDQIRGMDKIYRSATLSIIAALNTRDGGGIPGCSGRPRRSSIWTPPRHCEVERRGIHPNGMDYLDYSLWNRRGWTFQERVLSRRRLFITEFQVIFECSQGQACEELTYYPLPPYEPYNSEESEQQREMEEKEYHQIPAFTRRSTLGFDINHGRINYNMKIDTSLVDYCDWVEDYTSRQLSRGSDILNAFAGIGNYLNESLGTRLIFGLPEKFFPQTLMWKCAGLAEWRTEMPEIPTWSWASSLQPAYYYGNTGRSLSKGNILKIASLVYFYFQDPATGLRKLDVRDRWIDHEIAIEQLENEEGVPEITGKYIPGVWRSNKTWQECPHSPWQTLAHLPLDPAACRAAIAIPGSLVFNTTVASLKLGKEMPYARMDTEVTARDGAIRDQIGDLVGWLNNMSNDWLEAHQDNEKTYDFIVICGELADYSTRKTLGFWNRDFDTWRLRVMLIERLPLEPCVARRVDVGYIFAHKWKDCNPRWETIVLR